MKHPFAATSVVLLTLTFAPALMASAPASAAPGSAAEDKSADNPAIVAVAMAMTGERGEQERADPETKKPNPPEPNTERGHAKQLKGYLDGTTNLRGKACDGEDEQRAAADTADVSGSGCASDD